MGGTRQKDLVTSNSKSINYFTSEKKAQAHNRVSRWFKCGHHKEINRSFCYFMFTELNRWYFPEVYSNRKHEICKFCERLKYQHGRVKDVGGVDDSFGNFLGILSKMNEFEGFKGRCGDWFIYAKNFCIIRFFDAFKNIIAYALTNWTYFLSSMLQC